MDGIDLWRFIALLMPLAIFGAFSAAFSLLIGVAAFTVALFVFALVVGWR